MTHQLLDQSGELVIGTVLGEDKKQLSETAPVQPVAGLGRLERYEKIPDGRYLIVILGKSRVRVEPVESDHAFPVTRYETIEDENPLSENDSLVYDLKSLINNLGSVKNIPRNVTLSQLVDILIMSTQLTPEARYECFAVEDVVQRGKKIVSHHE